ncbi:MAG: SMC-Scp complex subunit ScpB [Rhodanobacteraceae bacterium]
MQSTQIKPIIEAALLGASHPLSIPQLAALFGADEQRSHDDVAGALEELKNDCDGRGVELVEVASGFRYQVRQSVHPWVARLWTEHQTRYSRALLETLALIAYRQPITRAEIEQVRGVAVATSIVRTLEEREWIRVVGYRDLPGRPALLGTTKAFLDYFNLISLDELPSLGEIREIDEIDEINPELALDMLPTDTTAEMSAASDAVSKQASTASTNAPQPTGPASTLPTIPAPHPDFTVTEPAADDEPPFGTTEFNA